MGWAVGFDTNWGRDIGYGVPAYCDQPECSVVIDRGLGYVCGREPFGGEEGCGLYFCDSHMQAGYPQLCIRCFREKEPFPAKPDHPEWVAHKLTDPSWERWRQENPAQVSAMQKDGI